MTSNVYQGSYASGDSWNFKWLCIRKFIKYRLLYIKLKFFPLNKANFTLQTYLQKILKRMNPVHSCGIFTFFFRENIVTLSPTDDITIKEDKNISSELRSMILPLVCTFGSKHVYFLFSN